MGRQLRKEENTRGKSQREGLRPKKKANKLDRLTKSRPVGLF